MKKNYSLLNRFLKTFFAIVLLLLSNKMFAQVDVTATGGTLTASYTTLKGAFDAINLGTHTGTITINISGNTNEAALTARLDSSGNPTASSYSSILIRPTGGAARTLSGATTAGAAMIELSGADNVTFDGLNTGGNSLTIENTTISATSGTSTIRFVNDATSNTITNCSVNGASTMTTTTNGGTIFFSTAASSTGTGNDNNTISFSNIGPSAGNSPAKAIYGNGSTTIVGNYNSNVTITNCNIFDYFVQGTSNGIYVSGGNTDWTISNNRFYQTGVRTTTATSVSTAVQIASATAGNNFLISNNTFGFANSSGTGFSSFTSSGGTVAYRALVISTALTGLPCVITGNIISGISISTSGSGSTTASMFAGAIVSP